MTITLLWNSFLDKIKNEISPASYEAWFSETELYELKDGTAKVSVPMSIQKKTIKENYNDLVEEIFTEVSGTNFKFEYYTKEEIDNNIEIDTDVIGVPSVVNFESNLNPHYTTNLRKQVPLQLQNIRKICTIHYLYMEIVDLEKLI